MSWFLFLSNDGNNGVGECEFAPGIKDAANGIFYVVPDKHIKEYFKKPRLHSAKTIERIILEYYHSR